MDLTTGELIVLGVVAFVLAVIVAVYMIVVRRKGWM
jgi:hypothetical protein